MTQRNTEKTFSPLTERENHLAKAVIDIAFSLHKALVPGLLESVSVLNWKSDRSHI